MTKGGRNLIILGVISVVVALTTTSVSLALYHNSGDIYLDRSRPGYLPDDAETEEKDPEVDFNFDKSGELTKEALVEYTEALKIEIEAIDIYENNFSADALSDEKLGL